MAVQLVISEEMIKLFHSCTQEGNYLPLFEEYGTFIESMIENLKKVNFRNNTYSQEISKNLADVFRYVKDFNPNKPSDYICKNEIPDFFEQLKKALTSKNWKNFYRRFQYLADILIKSARSQEIMDLKIAWGSITYETFADRDMAMASETSKIDVDLILKETLKKVKGVNPIFKNSSSHDVKNETSQPLNGDFPSKIDEGKQSVPTEIAKSNEFGSTKVSPGPKTESLQANHRQVIDRIKLTIQKWSDEAVDRQKRIGHLTTLIPKDNSKVTEVKESGLTKETRKTIEKQELSDLIKSTCQKLSNYENDWMRRRVESKDPPVRKEPPKKTETDQKTLQRHFDQRINNVNVSCNEKFADLRKKNPENNGKIGEVMNIMQNTTQMPLESIEHVVKQIVSTSIVALESNLIDTMEKRQAEIVVGIKAVRENEQENNNKQLKDRLKYMEQQLVKKMEQMDLMRSKKENFTHILKTIDKKFNEQEQKLHLREVKLEGKMKQFRKREELLMKRMQEMKIREDSLDKKMEDMKDREDSLDKKMVAAIEKSVLEQKEQLNIKEKALDQKMEEMRAKEELLDRKIKAMTELMREVFKQQDQPEMIEIDCSEKSDGCVDDSRTSAIKSNSRSQAIEETTEPHPGYYPQTHEPTVTSLPTDYLLDDEELRQIEEDFQRQRAEQEARHAAELEELKKRGRQKNEKAQGEIRELSKSVHLARERASFRQ